MNYFPNAVAKSLVQKKTYTIGVFFGNEVNSGFNHPFFLEVISAVREVVGNAGYDLLVFTNKNKQRATYTTLCRERSVDGVVLLLTGQGKERGEQLVELQDSGIPCIAIDIPLEGKSCTFVESDNYSGTKAAMNHLIQMGHKLIAFIGGDEISKTSYDRLRGYQDALMESKIGVNPLLIQLGYFSPEKASAATQQLAKMKPEITAFFVASDEMAISVIRTLASEGISVPEDISVVGFDDIKEAVNCNPPLTTVRQDKFDLGKQAAVTLLEIINNIKNDQYEPSPRTLSCDLIKRESTTLPRKRLTVFKNEENREETK